MVDEMLGFSTTVLGLWEGIEEGENATVCVDLGEPVASLILSASGTRGAGVLLLR